MIEHLGGSVTVDGVVYKIDHLEPFFHSLPGAGRDGDDLRVRVSFSCHAFSEKAKHGEAFDFLDHNDGGRRFCGDRYLRSLNLPSSIRALLDVNGVTWEMKDHNDAENMAALPKNPKEKIIKGTYDVIFYYLYPSHSEHFHVEMNVVSYHRRSVNTEQKSKLDMRHALRICLFSGERVPLTEEKRRAIAAKKTAEKKLAKREKRKSIKKIKK